MTQDELDDGRKRLAAFLAESSSAAAFTGAGISTESGIPDFRSKDSAWHRHPPMPFESFLASEDNRILAWERKFAMDDSYAGAQPSRGHRALSRLIADGLMSAVITQNIDGLHQASGLAADQVIELHGNGTYATCLACGVRYELEAIRRKFEADGRAPKCLCGGAVKSATIAFGQAMPVEPMRRAQRVAENCDLMLVIGSSLVVYPAASFPLLAKENGAALVIINRDPTPFDEIADLVLHGDIGAILEPFERANRFG
ncbi:MULTISPECIES: Sir2 family NAD-dependent protein deacetylase [unclassified Beijerinckia]|uniref:SIR2 family NAD-dependent protein deacylase n=1 Tax=unclassified Beijerinckia TaxID=2638183 RepID=UPI00089805BB|nr:MULTISPECIES: Sir2 family NAD-dependent protein deacetylase [unclassified Beijerinckia]MDH7795555.1 NAD-dependent deacetylase [Beijerinckia sp. GAS462]SEC06444.1 NAD-dependent deacetylase [Beijerinckia sp. 28-YEA-48]